MRTLRILACVFLAAFAAGCDDADTVPTAAPSPVASQIAVTTFPSYVLRSGSTATITARVTSSNGNSLANVPVTFSTTAGTLSAASAVTSDAGSATVTLEGTDAAVVTADASGARGEVSIEGRAPYAIRLISPSTVFTDGASFQVAVDQNISVVNPPSPSAVTLDCGTGNPVTITGTRQLVCTYPSAGTYTVRANATAANGWTLTEASTVQATARGGSSTTPPTSNVTPTVTLNASQANGREWRFTATSNVEMERFVFDFGEGDSSATRIAEGTRMTATEQHLYTAAGQKTVRVTAAPADRRPEVSATTTITVP
jgi:adhesin/invasin